MSTSNSSKKLKTFRLLPEHIEKIEELPKKDPMTYQSQAVIIDAMFDHFLNLSKAKHREIISKYLSKSRSK